MKVYELRNLIGQLPPMKEVVIAGKVKLKEEFEDATTGETINSVMFYSDDFDINSISKESNRIIIQAKAREI